MSEPLFEADGDHFVPGDCARGPWTPDALHGGPVAALVARAAERCQADPAMHVARITLDLLRPVPMAPLTVTAAVTRPGRKVQLVDVAVQADGRDVAWGRALRVRLHETGAPEADGLPESGSDSPVPGRDRDAPAPAEEGHSSPPLVEGYRAFHNTGAELRFVGGDFDKRGPAAVWVRLRSPVVAGESPSPVQRAAGAADFGNGVSSVLDYAQFVFINPELTVHLARPPVGEWVCLEAATRLGAPGTGLALSRLWDASGIVGNAAQALVIERRA